MASLANVASNYLIGGKEAQRLGTSHASIVPYQVMPTKDSFIMLGTGNEGQFKQLCHRLEMPHLIDDPRFRTNSDRVQHRTELIQLFEDQLTKETTAFWTKKFEDGNFPFAPINNIKQTFEHPQIIARGLVQEVEHERAGKIKLVGKSISLLYMSQSDFCVLGPPVKYSGFKPSIRLPPPVLGSHNNEVFKDILGYTDQAIEQLRQTGVIGGQ